WSGFASLTRGKNSAAFWLRVPMKSVVGSLNWFTAMVLVVHALGGSTSSMARRVSQYEAAAETRAVETSAVKENGGMQSRLKRSAFSSENSPLFALSKPGPVNCASATSLPSPPLPGAADTGFGLVDGGLVGGLTGVVVASGRTPGISGLPLPSFRTRTRSEPCSSTRGRNRGSVLLVDTFRNTSLFAVWPVSGLVSDIVRLNNVVSLGLRVAKSTRALRLLPQLPGLAASRTRLPGDPAGSVIVARVAPFCTLTM